MKAGRKNGGGRCFFFSSELCQQGPVYDRGLHQLAMAVVWRWLDQSVIKNRRKVGGWVEEARWWRWFASGGSLLLSPFLSCCENEREETVGSNGIGEAATSMIFRGVWLVNSTGKRDGGNSWYSFPPLHWSGLLLLCFFDCFTVVGRQITMISGCLFAMVCFFFG